MEQSSKGVAAPRPKGTILSAASIQKAQDVLTKQYKEALTAPIFSSGNTIGLYPTKEIAKPAQPLSEGAQAYMYGMLAAMCAGVCGIKKIYADTDHETRTGKSYVARLKPKNGPDVLIPIDFPHVGSTLPDDFFTALRARIVMECGE